MNDGRDVELDATPSPSGARAGRRVLVTIGIDRYRHWRRLANAVNDATGAQAMFRRLGFQDAVRPLLDQDATGAALHALVTDELTALGPEDSLVVFYAGHGGTRTHDLDGRKVKTGYIIPVDAKRGRASTWIDLKNWLYNIALLRPRHILVILDACHSGIALDQIMGWRSDDDDDAALPAPRDVLDARRSRRIITSALDDERALDYGPVSGHSLFTGYLIEALRGGIPDAGGVTTGAELGIWVRERVRRYPKARQTPDFGTFAYHDHGEMMIPLDSQPMGAGRPASQAPVLAPSTPSLVLAPSTPSREQERSEHWSALQWNNLVARMKQNEEWPESIKQDVRRIASAVSAVALLVVIAQLARGC